MNISFVLLSGKWGGAETVVYDLAKHLHAKGEGVSIILNQETYAHYSNLENVELFNIGSLYPPKSFIASLLRNRRGRNIVSRAFSLPFAYLDEGLRQRYLKRTRKRLLHFLSCNQVVVISPILEDSVPLVSCLADDLKALNIATIAMVAGEGNLRGSEPVHPLLRPIARWKAREFRKGLTSMDRVVGPSAFLKSAWENQGAVLNDRYVTIPNGVDLSEIRNCASSKRELKGEFNLLFPGGSRFVKGGDLVIACLPAVRRTVPRIHLYVALDVPADHMLRRMVRDLQLEDCVTFAGSLPKQELWSLLNSVDMLVMPSRDEAFGIVYLEAMALGKPIIAANKGGIPEVVKDGRNGLLVELEPPRIGEAIIRLHQNEDLRKEISRNNLQDVTRFDWGCIVDQYVQIYREVVQVKGGDGEHLPSRSV